MVAVQLRSDFGGQVLRARTAISVRCISFLTISIIATIIIITIIVAIIIIIAEKASSCCSCANDML